MESLPRFDFELIKQGTGNPITFQLGDVDDTMRSKLQNYSLTQALLRYWSFEVEEWFVTDSNLMDYNIYHLCLTYPESHQFAGSVQNVSLPDGFGSNVILIASTGVQKSIATGTPYIGGGSGESEFVFSRTPGTPGDTFNVDQLGLTIRDQHGTALSSSAKIKFKLRYREYVSFN